MNALIPDIDPADADPALAVAVVRAPLEQRELEMLEDSFLGQLMEYVLLIP